MENIKNLLDYENYFFSGIGGIGMSALAKYLLLNGKNVVGSDLKQGETVSELKKLGVKVFKSHDIRHLKNIDCIVYSSSVKSFNPEIKYAKSHGIPLIKRSELLGYIFTLFETSVSVSGTHGKTTASAMIATVLKRFKTCTAFVGGITNEFSNLYTDKEKSVVVAETCEYMRNFYDIRPRISVILNVDYDHVDCYKNIDEVIEAFSVFSSNSINIVNADDENSVSLKRAITFGIKNKADFKAKSVVQKENGVYFTLVHNCNKYKVFLPVIGVHHVYNALAAISCCYLLNVPIGQSVLALSEFKGISRRLEKIANFGKTTVYSDYAHHPKEIEKTVKAFLSVKKGKNLVVFQPHTYSRTLTLKQDFIRVLKPIKNLVIFRTYSAREDVSFNGSAQDLYNSLGNKRAKYVESVDALFSLISDFDNVLILGAGDLDFAVRNKLK